MRFLDNSNGRKDPSKSILDVGVKAALDKSGFDEEILVKRGKIQMVKGGSVTGMVKRLYLCSSAEHTAI